MTNNVSVLERHIVQCDMALKNNQREEMQNVGDLLIELYSPKITAIAYIRGNKSIFGAKELHIIKESLEVYKEDRLHELEIEKSKSAKVTLQSENNLNNESPNRFENIGNISGEIGNVKESGNSTNTNTNTNTNAVDLKTMFDSARKVIEEDEALGEEEVQEIIEQINEIEEVGNEDIARPQKWRKLKACFNWVSTKGVKVATTIMPLIMKVLEQENNN
ncbi:hypothetical protein CHL78_012125 [Romboutsia weinsteinii]|uniref:Uncharacterized protein n=1 Tax=Romboutsia weinsteinii TaxID=2020949 RepID=A0A371J1X4_9FIRM|nr:hypothetical protein [Romboutsia weinsteinii]RDY26811.1 hypothetical protein CHL78_012125 [Romboutsia weinsteinii]